MAENKFFFVGVWWSFWFSKGPKGFLLGSGWVVSSASEEFPGGERSHGGHP